MYIPHTYMDILHTCIQHTHAHMYMPHIHMYNHTHEYTTHIHIHIYHIHMYIPHTHTHAKIIKINITKGHRNLVTLIAGGVLAARGTRGKRKEQTEEL